MDEADRPDKATRARRRALPTPLPETLGSEGQLNLRAVEKRTIEKALRLCADNIAHAATLLGVTPGVLTRKLKIHGLFTGMPHLMGPKPTGRRNRISHRNVP